MAYLPILRPTELIKIVERMGFVRDRQSGSHAVFVHQDGRWTSVPIHRKTIGKGLLHKILRDIEVDPRELKRKRS